MLPVDTAPLSAAALTIGAMCNFEPPYDHSAPVHHVGPGGARPPFLEWPDECVWAQLQQERYNCDRMPDADTRYLANLEIEWERRGICSRCCREIDQDLAMQFAELKGRAENAERKLGDIRAAVTERPDLLSPPEIRRILDRT